MLNNFGIRGYNPRYLSNYQISYGGPVGKNENNRYANINNQLAAGKVDLSISYKNFDIDEDNRRIRKKGYGNELLEQMREKELKREEEKRRKKLEEMMEEERLRKERSLMEEKNREEERKRLEEIEKYKKENERIMNSYVVLSKPKKIIDSPKKEEKQNNEELIKQLEEKRKKEIEVFNDSLQNNLQKIRNNLIDQQNILIKELKILKEENLNGNLYKIDLHKSLRDLKEELRKKKFQEDLQKDILYETIVDSKMRKDKLNREIGLDKLYVNRSHIILDLNGKINLENKNYIDANIYKEELNKKYLEDKINLNRVLNKNEERLQKLTRIIGYNKDKFE